MPTAEQVRQAVADIAATPMKMSLEQWQGVSSVLLGAADEIERLRSLVATYEDREYDAEMDAKERDTLD